MSQEFDPRPTVRRLEYLHVGIFAFSNPLLPPLICAPVRGDAQELAAIAGNSSCIADQVKIIASEDHSD
jgi:hypothetical protein